MNRVCPDDRIQALLVSMNQDDGRAQRELETTLADYPGDARLHFLNGSLLAGQQDYAGACMALRRAVDIAPDYAVARFQLGFLLLTSGEAIAAQEAWGPLHSLPPDHYLRLFVGGLTALIGNAFDETARLLEAGIARNQENPAMTRDMQLIVDKVRRLRDAPTDGPASSVDLLLQQAAFKSTRH